LAKKKEDGVKPTISSWEITAASLQKKLGGTSFFCMGDDNVQVLDVQVIPTGLAALDDALGVFGFPRGRIIEIYGQESTGKSTLALRVVSQLQIVEPNSPIVYVDLEHALDPVWMQKNGVSRTNLWVAQPDSAEDALNVVMQAVESGQVPLVVLDSVAALASQDELDGEVGDQAIGKVARLMGQFCRKVVGPLKRHGSTLICINQIRQKIGPYGGETRPGGNALKFFASQIIKVRKSGDLAEDGLPIGIDVEADIKKNKVAPPHRTAIVSMFFNSGFSKELSLLDIASEMEIVDKSGAWYSYHGERLGQGRVNTAMAMSPVIFNQIYDEFKVMKMSSRTVMKTQEEPEGEPAGELAEKVLEV